MKSTIDIFEHIKSFTNAPFLVSQKGTVSFREFIDDVSDMAQNLKKSGVKRKSIVVALNIPVNDFPVLLFALWKIEAIVFPVNPKLPEQAVNKAVIESGAGFIVCGDKVSSVKKIKQLSYQELQKRKSLKSAQSFKLKLENTASVIMTSGSSGDAKYAVHSIANHYFSAKGVNEFLQFKTHSSWFMSLPLYHVGGFAIIVRCFFAGARLLIPDKRLQSSFVHLPPTHISLVSTQLLRLLKNREALETLKRCKAVLLGGSSISASLIRRAIKKNLNIFSSYGLTEMTSTVAISKASEHSSLATVLPFREIRISDEKEILIKGKCLFLGYMLKGKISLNRDKEGWFNSNDLGYCNLDGTMVVYGRKDNMFISGGENIYPEEIEKLLLEMDEIEQAIVVPQENSEFGFRPLAFIKSAKKLNFKTIENKLRAKVAPFKIPDKFLPWPKDLPLNEIKIKRSDLLKYLK